MLDIHTKKRPQQQTIQIPHITTQTNTRNCRFQDISNNINNLNYKLELSRLLQFQFRACAYYIAKSIIKTLLTKMMLLLQFIDDDNR